MNLLDFALTYAKVRRWCVIPLYGIRDKRCTCGRADCPSPGKHPRLTGWQGKATTARRIIADRFRSWPYSNVGIATGARSRLVVLDVDPRHGGDATLADVVRRYGPLPETPTVLTGGGGTHYYFRYPGESIANKISLAPGLDIRGDGGLVVAPPSPHVSGRRYCWDVTANWELSLAPAPAWLFEGLQDGHHNHRLRSDGTALQLHEGERNALLFRLACALRRYGLNASALRSCVEVINREHATPPLPATECEMIAASAARLPRAAEWCGDCGAPLVPPAYRNSARRNGAPLDEDVIIARALGMEWQG
jgi:hypothetical protein